MKRLLLLAVTLLSIGAASAQFSLQPVLSSTNFSQEAFDIHADATLTYTGGTPLTLRWNITNMSIPKEWNFYVCLGANCYIPGQTTGLHTIQPGEQMPIQAHVMPGGMCATGGYNVTFTDTTTNQQVAIGAFLYQCSTSSVDDSPNTSRSGAAIFPNPATTWFAVGEVNNASRIEIFNMIGKQVGQFAYQASGRYDISGLPSGMYLVRILDGSGRLLITRRLSKTAP